MRQRRPTIPIDVWRISLNLEETKSIQRDSKAPAYNCVCDLCVRWKRQYKELLPREIYKQLRRALVDLDFPTELYEFGNEGDATLIRVHFHVIGKILSGPQPARPTEMGRDLYYSEVRKHPYVSIAVIRHAETYEYHPEYIKTKSGEVILLDMRLSLPL